MIYLVVNFLPFNSSWNSNVKKLYEYDLLEIYGMSNRSNLEYKIPYWNRRDFVIKELDQRKDTIRSVFDVGAAQGNFSLALAENGFKVTWNDIRDDIVEYVKAKYEYGDIDFVLGNIFEINSDVRYDCVLITEVIEHVAHPDQFLMKCRDFLEPNGIIVMTTPNGRYFRNKLPKFSECSDPSQFELLQFRPDSDGHIFLLHPEEITKLAADCGMSVQKVQFFNNFFTSGHIKLRYILKYFPISIIKLLESLSQKLPIQIASRIHAQTIAVLVTDNLTIK